MNGIENLLYRESSSELGNIVPFVLWFNFAAGFVFVLAGAALLLAKRWATPVAFSLAVSTVPVFLVFITHIVAGGAFQFRTVEAISVRSLFWIVVALLAQPALAQTSAGSCQQ